MARVLRQCEGKQLVCVCCVCGEARDDIAADGAWYSLKALLSRYGMQEQDFTLSHTFCPGCFMHYKEELGLVPGRAYLPGRADTRHQADSAIRGAT